MEGFFHNTILTVLRTFNCVGDGWGNSWMRTGNIALYFAYFLDKTEDILAHGLLERIDVLCKILCEYFLIHDVP